MKLSENLKTVKNNAIEDAKLETARNLLLRAADLLDKKIVPLTETEEQKKERQRKEDKKTLVSALLLCGVIGTLLTAVGCKAKKGIERKENAVKEELEREKKDLYRTLSRIKGRV
jgi:hypothetical protein